MSNPGPHPNLDRALWFEPGCCHDGQHYLTHNPHTFPGRMGAWCEAHNRAFAVSRSEIERCSPEAEFWIAGFITGNEPPPPLDSDGYSIYDDDPRYRHWLEALDTFRATGAWPRDAPTGPSYPDS